MALGDTEYQASPDVIFFKMGSGTGCMSISYVPQHPFLNFRNCFKVVTVPDPKILLDKPPGFVRKYKESDFFSAQPVLYPAPWDPAGITSRFIPGFSLQGGLQKFYTCGCISL